MLVRLALTVGLLCAGGVVLPAAQSSVPTNSPTLALRVATFDVDATPPVGSMMAYDPVTNHWELGLRARGIVLLGAGEPIVLCAVDWIGIANEGHDVFCRALARTAVTSPRRVAVHSLHQHDAPDCDFSAERILKEAGVDPRQYEGRFQRQVIADLERAVRESLPRAQPVTHLGLGEARVDQVASNRRILGPDGKVRATRWAATKALAIRAELEGTIDPILSLVSLWNGERPVTVLSYYATHPQSYYRTGLPNSDFPGLARFLRQLAVPAALHVHFNGAGGNIGAGKYNDGSPENRLVLAERLADGMRRAWESTKRQPISADDVGWTVESVALPPTTNLVAAKLESDLKGRAGAFVAGGGVCGGRWRVQARLVAPLPSGTPTRCAMFEVGPGTYPAPAWRAICRIPTGRQGRATRPVRGDGSVWGLRALVYRHRGCLQTRRLRNRPGCFQRRTRGRSGADVGDPQAAIIGCAMNGLFW